MLWCKGFKQHTLDKKLAAYLHETNCFFNHTDGCDWFYEEQYKTVKARWNQTTHRSYLDKAQNILKNKNEFQKIYINNLLNEIYDKEKDLLDQKIKLEKELEVE